jgi:hypothetical protein
VAILSEVTLRADLRLPATPAPSRFSRRGDCHLPHLAARLEAAGIGSLRVDLRGHGESVDRGRFVPGQGLAVLEGTDRDVASIWRFVRAMAGVDTSRLAVVSGSYSSEAAAKAAREVGYGRAHVALSPGDFSDDSFRAAAASRAAWLFVRLTRSASWRRLDAQVRELGAADCGSCTRAGHAIDLLAADPT